jgi:hypothetical protein
VCSRRRRFTPQANFPDLCFEMEQCGPKSGETRQAECVGLGFHPLKNIRIVHNGRCGFHCEQWWRFMRAPRYTKP